MGDGKRFEKGSSRLASDQVEHFACYCGKKGGYKLICVCTNPVSYYTEICESCKSRKHDWADLSDWI